MPLAFTEVSCPPQGLRERVTRPSGFTACLRPRAQRDVNLERGPACLQPRLYSHPRACLLPAEPSPPTLCLCRACSHSPCRCETGTGFTLLSGMLSNGFSVRTEQIIMFVSSHVGDASPRQCPAGGLRYLSEWGQEAEKERNPLPLCSLWIP